MKGYLKYVIAKKFIKEYSNKLSRKLLPIKVRYSKIKKLCDEKGITKSVKREVITVLINGFVIWIVGLGIGYLTGFWKLGNPLLIPCYGILPWFTIEFVKDLKQNDKT